MENTHKSTTENTVSDNGFPEQNTGLAMPTKNMTHGVTDVVANASVTTTSMYKSPQYYSEEAPSNLAHYLQRPTIIASGSFTTGSTSFVYNQTLNPSTIVGFMPNLTGVLGVRATVCLRAEIAAAPQAAGIIRLAHEYLPTPNANPKNLYRPVQAQLPGAQINLRSASAVEHKIPFVSDRDFWFVKNGTYTNTSNALAISLFPYAPVEWDTTTVSTPSWVLYIWFEDVQFISKTIPTVNVTPQAGVGPEADHGKVSTWFRYASKIASYASSIPSLTSLALPVSWAFDAGAKIAAHFGWSKPNDGSYTGIMGMSMSRAINTCADADFCNPMGYYSNNEVGVLPGFAGSDLDEMSLCHLTCKPGLISSVRLLATDTRNQIKWTCPVSPAAFVFQSSNTGFAQLSAMGIGSTSPINNNKVGYFPSPVAFFSSFFERWRGDLIFRFHFNSTKFHAGKVLIGYVPGEDVYDGTTTGGFSQAPVLTSRYDFHSALLDLRTTEEYDFVVPFTYPAAFCDTGMTTNISGAIGVPNTGSVFLAVIEPLYGPDNVPQDVVVLVEVLAKCGLELSQPITSVMLPLPNNAVPVVVAQSGHDAESNAVTYASGERILSIKQLAMRPYWTTQYGASQINQANLAYYQPAAFNTTAGAYYPPTNVGDSILSRLSCAFALVRGGIIVRFLPAFDAQSTTPSPASWYSYTQWAISGVQDVRGAALALETRMANMIRIPYYGKNTRMRTGWSSGRITSDPNGTTRTLTHGANTLAPDGSSILGVAAADDYQLGCFTGVPPCVTYEPNNSVTYADPYMRKPLNT